MTDDGMLEIAAHLQAMPPVAAMGLRIAPCDGEAFRLHAPLALHLNDKGCAFGGSLSSLMTLAAWGLVALHCRRAAIDADVFVADARVRYLQPLFADLDASARLADGEDWHVFLATLRNRGRARIQVAMAVAMPDGGVAANASARYVAIATR